MSSRRGRIVLRGGRTIDVLLFEQLAAAAGPRAGAARSGPVEAAPDAPTGPLHVCPQCASELVYPVDWEEQGREHWQIALRCPECEWRGGGVYPQSAADAFDEELDRGTDLLAHDFDRLARANMADDIERFAHALEVDAVHPMDF